VPRGITSPLVAQGQKLASASPSSGRRRRATHLALWEGEQRPRGSRARKRAIKLDVPLGESEETKRTLAFQTSVGASLAELPLALHRGDLRPRPTSLSRAPSSRRTSRSKWCAVETGQEDPPRPRDRAADAGRHLFFTADQSGAVVLRILQNRLPVKTLAIDVPKDLPVGSPVEIVLRCDESMRLEAQATVGAQQIQAHIEPPPSPAAHAGDIEALLERRGEGAPLSLGRLGSSSRARPSGSSSGSARSSTPIRTSSSRFARGCVISSRSSTAGRGTARPADGEDGSAFDTLRRVVYRASASYGMSASTGISGSTALYDRALRGARRQRRADWRRGLQRSAGASRKRRTRTSSLACRLDDPETVKRRATHLAWRTQRIEQAIA
jgi:molecular chaperone DnaK